MSYAREPTNPFDYHEHEARELLRERRIENHYRFGETAGMKTTTTQPIAHDVHHLETLVHMLGAGSHIPKRNRGYRNRFCAEVNGEDYKRLMAMQELGLVVAGQYLNDQTMRYFYATEDGCKAIGLTKKQIERAMAP